MLPAEGNVINPDDCYSSLAEQEKNPALCEKISDADGKGYCLAISTGDTSHCENLEKTFAEVCRYNAANKWLKQ
jgi:hypothetical protein